MQQTTDLNFLSVQDHKTILALPQIRVEVAYALFYRI